MHLQSIETSNFTNINQIATEMAEIRFFMIPHHFFDIVESCQKRYKFEIIFQRRTQAGKKAGFRVATRSSDDLAGIYLSGSYHRMWLSKKSTPNHSADWEFTSRAAKELLEISGGRQQDELLEMTLLRTFAKETEMMRVYKALRRAIVDRCEKGMRVPKDERIGGSIYYEKEVEKYELRRNIDNDYLVYKVPD